MKNKVLCFLALLTLTMTISSCITGPQEIQVSRKVLTFYYGWYGNPEVSGRWVHWEGVDKENKEIENSTNYPVLGAYDNLNPEVVEQHCSWASEAGIDAFIASWWGPDKFTDNTLPVLLNSAQEYNLKVSAYFETTSPGNSPEQGLEYINYLLDNYSDHPAWLKVDGKPVIFVYGRAINEIGLEGWKWIIQRVNQHSSRDVIFIGGRISEDAAKIFQGIHTYNITGAIQGKSIQEIREWAENTYPGWVETAGDKISCLTIIPGYDDSKLDRPKPRPITSRHDGETYRVLWEEAISADPDWILITSYNEWHEGSEIEPSIENGDRELNTTSEFAPSFNL